MWSCVTSDRFRLDELMAPQVPASGRKIVCEENQGLGLPVSLKVDSLEGVVTLLDYI